MKRLILIPVLLFVAGEVFSQKYTTERSEVTFFSDAAIEDIKATNKKASGIFDTASGDIVFSIPIKSFQFAKSLMQEHFNEKYMESDKFPKSTFQGRVEGYDAGASGEHKATAAGKLTIHGVTRDVEIPGTIVKKDNKLYLKTKFMVKLADHEITIPQVLWQNIAEQVEVTAEFVFKPK